MKKNYIQSNSTYNNNFNFLPIPPEENKDCRAASYQNYTSENTLPQLRYCVNSTSTSVASILISFRPYIPTTAKVNAVQECRPINLNFMPINSVQQYIPSNINANFLQPHNANTKIGVNSMQEYLPTNPSALSETNSKKEYVPINVSALPKINSSQEHTSMNNILLVNLIQGYIPLNVGAMPEINSRQEYTTTGTRPRQTINLTQEYMPVNVGAMSGANSKQKCITNISARSRVNPVQKYSTTNAYLNSNVNQECMADMSSINGVQQYIATNVGAKLKANPMQGYVPKIIDAMREINSEQKCIPTNTRPEVKVNSTHKTNPSSISEISSRQKCSITDGKGISKLDINSIEKSKSINTIDVLSEINSGQESMVTTIRAIPETNTRQKIMNLDKRMNSIKQYKPINTGAMSNINFIQEYIPENMSAKSELNIRQKYMPTNKSDMSKIHSTQEYLPTNTCNRSRENSAQQYITPNTITESTLNLLREHIPINASAMSEIHFNQEYMPINTNDILEVNHKKEHMTSRTNPVQQHIINATTNTKENSRQEYMPINTNVMTEIHSRQRCMIPNRSGRSKVNFKQQHIVTNTKENSAQQYITINTGTKVNPLQEYGSINSNAISEIDSTQKYKQQYIINTDLNSKLENIPANASAILKINSRPECLMTTTSTRSRVNTAEQYITNADVKLNRILENVPVNISGKSRMNFKSQYLISNTENKSNVNFTPGYTTNPGSRSKINFVQQYIKRHGRAPVKCVHPSVKKVLQENKNVSLPNQVFKFDIDPVVSLDRDEVTNWYDQTVALWKRNIPGIIVKRIPSIPVESKIIGKNLSNILKSEDSGLLFNKSSKQSMETTDTQFTQLTFNNKTISNNMSVSPFKNNLNLDPTKGKSLKTKPNSQIIETIATRFTQATCSNEMTSIETPVLPIIFENKSRSNLMEEKGSKTKFSNQTGENIVKQFTQIIHNDGMISDETFISPIVMENKRMRNPIGKERSKTKLKTQARETNIAHFIQNTYRNDVTSDDKTNSLQRVESKTQLNSQTLETDVAELTVPKNRRNQKPIKRKIYTIESSIRKRYKNSNDLLPATKSITISGTRKSARIAFKRNKRKLVAQERKADTFPLNKTTKKLLFTSYLGLTPVLLPGSNNYKKNILRVDKASRMFMCKVCEFICSSKKKLSSHEYLHLHCKICDKHFDSMSLLETHSHADYLVNENQKSYAVTTNNTFTMGNTLDDTMNNEFALITVIDDEENFAEISEEFSTNIMEAVEQVSEDEEIICISDDDDDTIDHSILNNKQNRSLALLTYLLRAQVDKNMNADVICVN